MRLSVCLHPVATSSMILLAATHCTPVLRDDDIVARPEPWFSSRVNGLHMAAEGSVISTEWKITRIPAEGYLGLGALRLRPPPA